MTYEENATPRTSLGGGVYTSTDYPASETIELHHEAAYAPVWPTHIYFACVTPAASGGATTLADGRRVLERLPESLVDAFRELGVLYVRHYGAPLGLRWEDAFGTSDKADVEALLQAQSTAYEWIGDELRTMRRHAAILDHPVTGEASWFNQVTAFNVSTLGDEVAAMLIAEVGEERVPKNTYYGDGTRIAAETLATIRAAYAAETRAPPWQRGDILLVDNLLVAHGRQRFTGERRVVVAMAGGPGCAA
jgi:hypothetical protein